MQQDLDDAYDQDMSTNWGYVRATLESWQTVLWMWRELTTPLGRRKLKQMAAWSLLRSVVMLTATTFMARAALLAAINGAEATHWALLFLLTLGLAGLLRTLHDLAAEWSLGETIVQVDYALNVRFFDKSLGQHRSKGNVLDAANVEKGRGRAWEMMMTLMWQGTEASVQIMASLIFLFFLVPTVGGVFLLVLVGFLTSMVLINRNMILLGNVLDQEFRALNRRRADLWEHAQLVIWADAVDREIRALHTWSRTLIGKDRSLWLPYLLKADVRATLVLLTVGLVYYWAVIRVGEGTLAPVVLVPLAVWGQQFANALEQLRNLDRLLNWNGPAIRAMRDGLQIPNDVPEHPEARPLEDGLVGLRVENITYAYGDGMSILRGTSLHVAPGERVAIVGKSGTGKSTLLRLLMREMDVQAGQICVGNTPLAQLQRGAWRRAVGHIPQKPNPLNDTVRANLLFCVPEAARSAWSDESLWSVMESVQLGNRERFPAGLDTVIGKRGLDLSGGEQQRLMVARALVQRPSLLLVDEATSSLDAETEEEVQAAIDAALSSQITAVIITHRLSTIANVDRVIVMDEGRVVDEGTHAALYGRCELFRRLCEKQRIAYTA